MDLVTIWATNLANDYKWLETGENLASLKIGKLALVIIGRAMERIIPYFLVMCYKFVISERLIMDQLL